MSIPHILAGPHIKTMLASSDRAPVIIVAPLRFIPVQHGRASR